MPQSVLGDFIFGDSKPKVPQAPNVDASVQTAKALAIDKSEIPSLEDMASKFNEFSSDELLKALNKVLPGYSDIIGKEGADVKSLLGGELPKDVQDFIGRKAADLGVSTGAGGQSSFTKMGQLRSLGLTSLDAMTRGFDAASRWIASAPKPHQYDFTSLLWTPQEQIGNEWRNKDARFSTQWLQNQIDAIPPAWQQGIDKVLNWAETTAANYATSSLCGMGGGMGGGSSSMGGGGAGKSASSADSWGQMYNRFMDSGAGDM